MSGPDNEVVPSGNDVYGGHRVPAELSVLGSGPDGSWLPA
jgi:hypothetical protein